MALKIQHFVVFKRLWLCLIDVFLLPRPSNVILVIAAALNYAFPQTVDLIATFIVVLLVVVVFTLLCIYTSQDFQLKVAKMLTLAFSIVMTITTVGLMAQVCLQYACRLSFHQYES